jgi:hypothetical protein
LRVIGHVFKVPEDHLEVEEVILHTVFIQGKLMVLFDPLATVPCQPLYPRANFEDIRLLSMVFKAFTELEERGVVVDVGRGVDIQVVLAFIHDLLIVLFEHLPPLCYSKLGHLPI